jgi:hypothetical protein
MITGFCLVFIKLTLNKHLPKQQFIQNANLLNKDRIFHPCPKIPKINVHNQEELLPETLQKPYDLWQGKIKTSLRFDVPNSNKRYNRQEMKRESAFKHWFSF